MSITKIEWADRVWNPITGCSPCSPGCDHCYARRMATRLRGRCGYSADDPFRVTLHRKRLDDPLHWRKPARIFICSMGDFFHPEVPFMWVEQVFERIRETRRHTFCILTKRPQIAENYWTWRREVYLGGYLTSAWPDNAWLGVTVCNQEEADRNLPILLRIPAARHFVSIEPMLGPINLPSASFTGAGSVSAMEGLDWVIVGGETGPGARPMHPEWVRSIRDQCKAAGVPLFLKSWGEWAPKSQGHTSSGKQWGTITNDGWYLSTTPWNGHDDDGGGEALMIRVGKRAAGNLLDGNEYREVPNESRTTQCNPSITPSMGNW